MIKILAFLFIFPFLSFSFDESYFDSQINQCVCASKNNECNPYCYCDPLCTDDQKKEFNFHLPESFSDRKISCDTDNIIDKTNLNSIKKEILSGVNCYSIEGNENGKKIKNYSPKDFGIDNFIQAADSPFQQNDKFGYRDNNSYVKGEKLVGNSTQFNPLVPSQNFYLPISIGSSTCNALVPVLAGVSYPKYSCRINSSNPKSSLSSIAYIGTVFDRSGTSTWLTFPLFNNFNRAVRDIDYFLHFQYIFPFDDLDTNTSYNFSIKVSSSSDENNIFAENYLAFSFEVFFGLEANYYDNEYQPTPMGYYYGVPIMIDTTDKESMAQDDIFTDKRVPLRIGNSIDVLFGVNSTVIIPLNQSRNAAEQLFPECEKIYKSYGRIIADADANIYFIKVNETEINELSNFHRENLKTPIAYWIFYYKKFNNDAAPIFLLQKYTAFANMNTDAKATTAMIKVLFYEVDDEGNMLVEEEIKFHSQSYSTLFDFFFRDTSESLETIGVFFCFAMIGTIWCWYVCFFYIED